MDFDRKTIKKIINTNLRDDGVLEIFHGNELLATVEDGKPTEKFIEDTLYGMGYIWNEDGTISSIK